MKVICCAGLGRWLRWFQRRVRKLKALAACAPCIPLHFSFTVAAIAVEQCFSVQVTRGNKNKNDTFRKALLFMNAYDAVGRCCERTCSLEAGWRPMPKNLVVVIAGRFPET